MVPRIVTGPGTLIDDRYVILERMARGGQGCVYKAQDAKTEKHVALKLLGTHVAADPVAFDRLMLEARVAARAGSENIVDVLDVGIDAATGNAYLVMEFLEGRDLERLVAQQGPCPTVDVAEYLRQTALGLDKAHACKDERGTAAPIIHRDLKPENLFLTRRENGTHLIKILDFGIAKQVATSSGVSLEVKGTPLYMAPEQFSLGHVTTATDTWAMGLIAFFLLTGRSYWRAGQGGESSEAGMFAEIVAKERDAPSQRLAQLGVMAALPQAFDAWFLRCVDRDPPCRFQSAGEAARALHATLGLSGPGSYQLEPTPFVLERSGLTGTMLSNRQSEQVTVTLQPYPDSSRDARPPSSTGRESRHWSGLPWVVGGSLAAIVLGLSAFGLLTDPRASANTSVPTAAASASAITATTSALPLSQFASPAHSGWSGASAIERPRVDSSARVPSKPLALSMFSSRKPAPSASSSSDDRRPVDPHPKLPPYPWRGSTTPKQE